MNRPWWVLHVDLDEFIAAVEVLRQPELAGRPVIVGGEGDPTQRAVVSTASYAAREYGVRSGMPLRSAVRKCPDAIVLPVDQAAYEEVSERVMRTLRSFDVVVEVIGWDEAFLGARTDDPEDLAVRIKGAVRDRTRLSCAVGIGDNKLRAKIATGFAKPGGTYRLTARNWFELMGDRPTEELWGIGRKTARRLAELGLHTVAELAASDRAELAEAIGPKLGPWYWLLGQGFGDSEVSDTPWVARSRSRETTFQQNLADWTEVRDQVRALVHRVVADVAAEKRPVIRVGVKVRFAPFITRTRSVTLSEATMDPASLEQGALAALEKFDEHHPVRLLGVRAQFVDPG